MSRGTKTVLLILAGLAVIAAILVVAIQRNRMSQPASVSSEQKNSAAPPAVSGSATSSSENEPVALNDEEHSRAAVSETAMIFTERYGSFSTESDFQNLRDVFPLVTARLHAILEAQIAAPPPSATYLGTTTRALRTVIRSFDASAGSASVEVSTQRVTSGARAATTYETLALQFKQEKGIWKVDAATWRTTQ